MALSEAAHVQKLALKAVFSDDKLMQMLVFKGGNALDMIYGPAARSSMDLDFSMEGELLPAERLDVKDRIDRRINQAFWEGGYAVDSVSLCVVPQPVSGKVNLKLGGYDIGIGYRQRDEPEDRSRALSIEISKCEHCGGKRSSDFEGLKIYVYTPEMIVIEKLRAICQQTRKYAAMSGYRSRWARARDFFDIETTMNRIQMDLTSQDNLTLLKQVFRAKDVPLWLLAQFPKDREFHRQDFQSVQDTAKASTDVREFDFYFDSVLQTSQSILEALGVE